MTVSLLYASWRKKEIYSRMSAKISYHFIEATKDHAQQIVDTTNDAFIVDAFFKKPEYHLRFNYEELIEMLKVENALFIIAVRDDDGSVIASIHLEIDIKEEEDSITVSELEFEVFSF